MNQALVGLRQRHKPMIVVGRDHLVWTFWAYVPRRTQIDSLIENEN
jgi:hypothetical protein